MTLATGRKKQANEGFTLVELVMVCAIISVLLAVSMPVFSKIYVAAKIKSVTRELSGTLQYAYQAAVNEGTRYKLILDPPGKRYWLQKEEDPLNRAGVFTDLQTAVVKTRFLPEGVSFRKVSQETLFFNPSGAGDSEKIYLENKDGEVFTIWYNGLAGQLQVFDYEN